MGENFDKKVLEWKSNTENSLDITVSDVETSSIYIFSFVTSREPGIVQGYLVCIGAGKLCVFHNGY